VGEPLGVPPGRVVVGAGPGGVVLTGGAGGSGAYQGKSTRLKARAKSYAMGCPAPTGTGAPGTGACPVPFSSTSRMARRACGSTWTSMR
jgi:hypothetical protein